MYDVISNIPQVPQGPLEGEEGPGLEPFQPTPVYFGAIREYCTWKPQIDSKFCTDGKGPFRKIIE